MKWTLAAVALILGGLAAFAGNPYPRPREVSAVELTQWIKDRKPGLRIIDLRSRAAFDAYHIPTSVWMPAEPVSNRETVVIVADGAVAVPSRAYILRGGIDEWRKTSSVTRDFGGVRRGGC